MAIAVSVESRAQTHSWTQASCPLKINSGLGPTPVQSRRVFLLGLKRSGFPRKIHKHWSLCARAQGNTQNMLRSSTFSHSFNILYVCVSSFSIDLAKSSHVKILKCQITRMFLSWGLKLYRNLMCYSALEHLLCLVAQSSRESTRPSKWIIEKGTVLQGF